MPPSSTGPLRDPAKRRTAEWPSRCQGEASSARTLEACADTSKVAAAMVAACLGTMVSMARLYKLDPAQTIELLVMDVSKLDLGIRLETWLGNSVHASLDLTAGKPDIRI